MKRIPLVLCSATAVALLISALPVSAAAQGPRAGGQTRTERRAVTRGEEPQAQPSAQPEPQRSAESPRSAEPRRAEPQRADTTPRTPPSRRVESPNAVAVPRTVPRAVMPQVVVPQVVQPRVDPFGRADHPAYRPDYRPNYRPGYRLEPRRSSRPLYFPDYRPYYRPYYAFQPRLYVGFGLWAGFPVAYPTYFYPASSYPYAYTYPYPSAYPNATPVYPVPGATAAAVGAAGGLSFEITPPDARLYVDGQYAGIVSQFTPNLPPLPLTPGRHHVEVHASGFEVIAFDVDILPGQVIPYRGDLRRF